MITSNEKPTIYNSLEMAYDYEYTMIVNLSNFINSEAFEKLDELDKFLIQQESTIRDELVKFLGFALDKANIKHKAYDPYFTNFQNKLHEMEDTENLGIKDNDKRKE